MSGSVLKAWNPISSQWEVVLVGKQGPAGPASTVPGPAGATGPAGPAGTVVYDDDQNILAHQVFS